MYAVIYSLIYTPFECAKGAQNAPAVGSSVICYFALRERM